MKKIFSIKTLIIAGITYALIGLAFGIGYLTHTPTPYVDLGPVFSGIIFAFGTFLLVFPGSALYILAATEKNLKFAILGYLLLTLPLSLAFLFFYGGISSW